MRPTSDTLLILLTCPQIPFHGHFEIFQPNRQEDCD